MGVPLGFLTKLCPRDDVVFMSCCYRLPMEGAFVCLRNVIGVNFEHKISFCKLAIYLLTMSKVWCLRGTDKGHRKYILWMTSSHWFSHDFAKRTKKFRSPWRWSTCTHQRCFQDDSAPWPDDSAPGPGGFSTGPGRSDPGPGEFGPRGQDDSAPGRTIRPLSQDVRTLGPRIRTLGQDDSAPGQEVFGPWQDDSAPGAKTFGPWARRIRPLGLEDSAPGPEEQGRKHSKIKHNSLTTTTSCQHFGARTSNRWRQHLGRHNM